MKQYLVQLALGDEWHRVFLGERRVGLGIIVVISYFFGKLVEKMVCFCRLSQKLNYIDTSFDIIELHHD